ncbi:MAG TPA: rRNA maturation RNase YbeY [Stellaceae bacterium]|nr:rRNA maturation RNase YbeY [Stellaceae bacterium]
MSEITVAITLASRRWRAALPGAKAVAEAAARAALKRVYRGRVPAGGVELSLVLGDDPMVRGLNRQWRGQDRPTNVLSFATGERPRAERPLLLGDVVLAYETVRRESLEQMKPLADHLAHLVTHGVLHLVGYDHEAASEARRMETLERRILAELGVPDPYGARAGADV